MVSIIPQPLHVRTGDGHLPLGDVVVRVRGLDEEQSTLVDLATRLLAARREALVQGDARDSADVDADSAGADAAPAGAAGPAPVVVELQVDPEAGPDGSTSPERYTLAVDDLGVTATAPTPAGLLHAVQTLRQLVEAPPVGEQAPRLPHVVVHDAPRYPWRGLSVDVARHFFDVEQLEAVVDVLAAYKLNVLHLHLTDDQGWRIESPSRPELAKLSSGSDVSGGPGGYLSVAQFRDLQDYAAARFVAVVPEIDVPGHINAATHVYGDLMPDGKPTDAYQGIEVGFSRLTFDLPATEPFLRDVFTDLARMTDGEYVHIGGDEVLTMDAAEYARFVELCERIVLEEGKKVVAWQEVARAGVRPGTLVQFWDTHKMSYDPFIAAAEQGARFLMSPGNRAYLDMKYTEDHPLGQAWAGLVELRDSYEWEPEEVVPGLPADCIEGVEAAIWTETIRTTDDLFSMLLPRLTAVAEVAWTAPERKDWEDYRRRVAVEAAAWRRDAVAFHPTPQVDW